MASPPRYARRVTDLRSSAVPGALQAGDRLAGRYVLLEQVGGGPACLWRADDEVLARPVAVRLADASGAGGRLAVQPLLDAAVRTGAASHPGLVRVYDADVQALPRGPVAYVISEWVEGRRLDDLLQDDGPLDGPEASDLVRQVADALRVAHARGLRHGRLHPGNLLVTADGRVRLTDVEIAAVLTPADPPREVTDDTRDLAAVAFALVTGRWPLASPLPPGSLPIAGSSSARKVRAAVSRELDDVLVRALDRPATAQPSPTPAGLADLVEQAVVPARKARLAALEQRGPSRRRRFFPWALALMVVGAVAIGGYLLGLAVGDLPRRDNAVDAIVTTSTSPTSPTPPPGGSRSAGSAVDLTRVAIRDFDPPPGDGSEAPDQVRNAVDGDSSTAWTTDRYDSAALGGLKSGVGLLLDLGSPTALRTVQVGLTAPGASLQVRAADTVGVSAESFRLVASVRDTGQLATLLLPPGAKGRYWLVWLTRLPRIGRGYQVGVSELRFVRS